MSLALRSAVECGRPSTVTELSAPQPKQSGPNRGRPTSSLSSRSETIRRESKEPTSVDVDEAHRALPAAPGFLDVPGVGASDDDAELEDTLAASAVAGEGPPAGPQWVHGKAPLVPHALEYGDKPLCATLDGLRCTPLRARALWTWLAARRCSATCFVHRSDRSGLNWFYSGPILSYARKIIL
jgi:hypothetical protein